jgi:pantetheine-phosphate adenylyltransferase
MPANPHAAVYTGMFDPVHLGHLDIIERGRRIFERVVIGVGVNPEKTPLFSIEERVHLIQLVVKPFVNVDVQPFSGLAVRFVKQVAAGVMIRGLRTVSDMEYEFSMSLTNQTLGTLIRQIAAVGGDLSKFLPPPVVPLVEAKIRQRK